MFEDKNVLNMLAQYNEVFKDDPATKQEMVITLLCDMGESLFQKGTQTTLRLLSLALSVIRFFIQNETILSSIPCMGISFGALFRAYLKIIPL